MDGERLLQSRSRHSQLLDEPIYAAFAALQNGLESTGDEQNRVHFV
jgi:hypothetical protein